MAPQVGLEPTWRPTAALGRSGFLLPTMARSDSRGDRQQFQLSQRRRTRGGARCREKGTSAPHSPVSGDHSRTETSPCRRETGFGFAPTWCGHHLRHGFPALVYRTLYSKDAALKQYTTFVCAVERGYAVVVQACATSPQACQTRSRSRSGEPKRRLQSLQFGHRAEPWLSSRAGRGSASRRSSKRG